MLTRHYPQKYFHRAVEAGGLLFLSGLTADDRTLDLKGQTIEAGVTIVKIKIVLEHKDDVLWLPPDAVRSFEGRRFVVVRQGERERRVTVRTGIETEEQVEILEGVEEGDVIVGQ